jgi:hypothetical protein
VEVDFNIRDDFFRYIWSQGSYVKLNGGLFGQSQLEVTRATNGFALAVTQPVFRKTIDELRELVSVETNQWQLSQYVFDAQSNVVYLPYQPYDGLTPTDLDKLAALNLESNVVYAYNNRLHSKRVVGAWRQDLWRYDFYDQKKGSPIELPAAESVPIADRIDRMVGQVESALPGVLALTNKLVAILENTAQATSNLNTTIAAAQPMVTNFALISTQLRDPGGLTQWALGTNGDLQLQGTLTNLNSLLGNTDTNLNRLTAEISMTLENVAGITSNLNAQVQANSNILWGISKTVMDADDMIQGLKRHWLLRSAFKAKSTNAPAASSLSPLKSPRAASN